MADLQRQIDNLSAKVARISAQRSLSTDEQILNQLIYDGDDTEDGGLIFEESDSDPTISELVLDDPIL